MLTNLYLTGNIDGRVFTVPSEPVSVLVCSDWDTGEVNLQV